MKATILGGRGFIGTALADELAKIGYDVEVLTRSKSPCSDAFCHPKVFCSPWNGRSSNDLIPYVEGADVVINLIGESIAARRWSDIQKEKLYSSRLAATKALAEAVQGSFSKPKAIVQASAVGFYGYQYLGVDPVDEYGEQGEGFLASLCRTWEDAILPVEEMVEKLLVVRFGVVLGRGGFLSRLILPFRLGLGGRISSGLQPFPWIHIDDATRSIVHLIRTKDTEGVYNLVSPEYANNLDFTKAFGRALRRPTLIPIPAKALELLFGKELTTEVLLGGREILPSRLLNTGFKFEYKELQKALNQIIR